MISVNSKATAFKYYDRGILDTESCGVGLADHAVLAIGWGVEQVDKYKTMPDGSYKWYKEPEEYFIIKNSWSKYWGEQGYVRISSRRKTIIDGACAIYTDAYIPEIETDDYILE